MKLTIDYFLNCVSYPVVVYHPQNKFSLSAVNRIQVGANINLLPTLEQTPESLSDLQMEAGFNLAGSIDPFYSKNSFVAKYISGWVDCPSALPPTWKNLLMVLKQLKEVSLANKIEKYLTESTEHVGKHGIPKPINGISIIIVISHKPTTSSLPDVIQPQVQKKCWS